MKNILSPSILSADFSALIKDIRRLESAGVDTLHIDVMDGSFVPNISFGMPVIKSIRDKSDSFFDVHMMVREPVRFLEDLKAAGADAVTVHAEACLHLDMTVNKIKSLGMKAGVSLNPATDLSTLKYILPELDLVLLMSVNPGFGGQKFIPYTLDKIRELRKMAPNLNIMVDGGVKKDNLREILSAGANMIVAGSAILKPQDKIEENVRDFLEIMAE